MNTEPTIEFLERAFSRLPLRSNSFEQYAAAYDVAMLAIQRLRSPSPGVRRTIRRIKVPADKFEIRWLGDPDVEVVLASDYDALSAVAEPVQGEPK